MAEKVEQQPTNGLPQLDFTISHAFIIGIDDYEDRDIPSLKTAVNDASKIAEVLAKQQQFIVHEPLLNAKRAAIENLFKSLPDIVGENDRVFFYYAGHGVAVDGADGRPDGYLVPADASAKDIAGSAVSMDLMYKTLDALKCNHLFLVLDCCFAGAFRWSSNTRDLLSIAPKSLYQEHFDRFVREPAWQVLTSSAYDQKALDVLDGKPAGDRGIAKENSAHSPFAHFLIQGLAGAADVRHGQEGDGVITATELYAYIRDMLEPESIELGDQHRQTPSFFPLPKHRKGEFIFLNMKNRRNLPRIAGKNPYKGLQSFDEEDQDLFYGRDQVVADLRAKAEKYRLLVVVGASGIGKSSVIKAGLLPVLRANGCRILPVIRPGIDPVGSLQDMLKKSKLLPGKASLKSGPPPALLENLGRQKTVLLIDQYEELVTQCSDHSKREQFKDILKYMLDNTPHDALQIILTARADFEPQLARGALADDWKKGRCTVPPFTVEELREAITGPTEQEAFIFDPPELVDEIIEEVVQSPGALPLLSYTLSELYNAYVKDSAGEHRALKRQYYDQLGGVMGALHTKADTLYNSLKSDEEQPTMRKVMLRMVSLEGETAGRRVMNHELRYASRNENRRVKKIVDMLETERLIVRGKDYIEPAHDALVRAWATLHDWIDEEGKDKLRLLDRAKTAANDYRQVGKLWDDDPRLETLKGELANKGTLLNKREIDFLRKSKNLKEKKQKRRKTVITATIASLSVLTLVAVAFAIYALVKKGEVEDAKYYDQNFSVAKQLEEKAGRKTGFQDARELQKSWLYTLAALGKDLRADKSLPISQSRLTSQGIAAGMYQQLWSSPGALNEVNSIAISPDGELFAIAANDGLVRICDLQSGAELGALNGHHSSVSAVAFSHNGTFLASASLDSTIILRQIAQDSLGLAVQDSVVATLRGHRAGVLGIAFSPDGKMLASAAADSTIRFWNLAARSGLSALFFKSTQFQTVDSLSEHKAPVNCLAFSPGGKFFASGDRDGRVILWNAWSKKPLATARVFEGGISTLAFQPGDSLLVSGGDDFYVRFWGVSKGTLKERKSDDSNGSAIRSLAFSPEGARMASGADNGKILLWDVATYSMTQSLAGHDGAATSLVFHPDTSKNWLISGSHDRSVRLLNAKSGSELATTAGHRDRINCVAFGANDSLLATGSHDGTVILWDIASGRQLHTLRGHTGAVLDLAFSKDGRLLVTASADSTVRLWRTGDFNSQILMKHKQAVTAVAINSDGTLVVSGSRDKTVRFWTISDNAVPTLPVFANGIESLALSTDGAQLVCGESDGTVSLWDMQTRQEIGRWQAHEQAVNGLIFDPTGNRLATASSDDEIRIWNIESNGQMLSFLEKNAGQQWSFSLAKTTQYMLTDYSFRLLGADDMPERILSPLRELQNISFKDKEMFVSQVKTRIADAPAFRQFQPVILKHAYKRELVSAYRANAGDTTRIDPNNTLQILRGHDDDVLSVDFSRDGRFLASGSGDESIRIWDVKTASELTSLQAHTGDVTDVAFNSDGKRLLLASASIDRTARLWDIRESTNLDTVIDNEDLVRALAFSPDSSILASVSEDHILRLWPMQDGRVATPESHQGGWAVLMSIAFSPDNKYIAYGAKDDNIRLWDRKTHRIYRLEGHSGDGTSVAFSNDGAWLASGSSDGKIRIWDVQTRLLLDTKEAHDDKVRSMAFCPTEDVLASGGSDKLIHLWKVAGGKLTYWKTYDNHKNGVWGVAFSHNGNFLASGSWDNSIHLRNIRTDKLMHLHGHRGPVLSVAFSPDDERLASGSWDNTVRVWDAKNGAELDALPVHNAPVTSVAFHPNGRLLASGSRDKTIRLRDLSYLDTYDLSDSTTIEKVRELARASRDTSARLHDLLYLTDKQYKSLDSLNLPYKTIFQAYAYRLSYHLNNNFELIDEPRKFYLLTADTDVFKAEHPFEKLRQPRKQNVGPIEWVLMNASNRIFTQRRQPQKQDNQ